MISLNQKFYLELEFLVKESIMFGNLIFRFSINQSKFKKVGLSQLYKRKEEEKNYENISRNIIELLSEE